MIVKMDEMSSPSSWELAQRLYDKNVELENRRRKTAQARAPLDLNAWQQLRENYEAIILEDHAFSEQHNVEYTLWQLHYRRIEEFRALFTAAQASMASNTSQGGKVLHDRMAKIRLQLKNFLSEATGFYHGLLLNIRAKYGIPLGYLSEVFELQADMKKSGKKSVDVKKGLISCHRCLIYLGDLARYKEQYGEGDPKSRDFTAASSYYQQAASLWPSSGNPHHQLAILASYECEELVAVYRYFRSLAVELPFSTARDNLIVAFEKNRQSYSQMHGDAKVSVPKEPHMRITGKGRSKRDVKLPYKDSNTEANNVGLRSSSIGETYKEFCIRFVRLNGILFTRTSLETFEEVLSSVSNILLKLLSCGAEEALNFGEDAMENALVVVRLIAILIFTVHNANRQTDAQTYAEILQRNVLLQNACTAVFDFMAEILKRVTQLHDPSSSYLLPGILIFLEWLACCPDVAACSDVDEKQAATRSAFWNQYTSFLNKLLSTGLISVDDEEDETCFSNMSSYDEGETDGRTALWEDFELRGFLPLVPAQTILNFARKYSFSNDGNKEKAARIRRVFAAGKALKNVVKVGQNTIFFDSKVKKYMIGIEPQKSENMSVDNSFDILKVNDVPPETPAEKKIGSGFAQSTAGYLEGEEEDEEIVFKPTVSEKLTDSARHSGITPNSLAPGKNVLAGDSQLYGASLSAPMNVLHLNGALSSGPQPLAGVARVNPPLLQHPQNTLTEGLKSMNINQTKQAKESDPQEWMGMPHRDPVLVNMQLPVYSNGNGVSYGQTTALETLVPATYQSAVSSGFKCDGLVGSSSSVIPPPSRSPVSRPVRHHGPPPGFSRVTPKQINEPTHFSDMTFENPLMDDYSWLDGYQLPESMKGSGLQNSIDCDAKAGIVSKSSGIMGTVGFPFPGKQFPPMHFQVENQKLWRDFPVEHGNLHSELQLQQNQQLARGTQQFTPLTEPFQGPSIWTGSTGQYYV